MRNHPENLLVNKLHEAFNSLNVTGAYIQLNQRRLLRADRTPLEAQLLESLRLAGDRLRIAVAQLRDVEAMLGNESENPTENENLRAAGANETALKGEPRDIT